MRRAATASSRSSTSKIRPSSTERVLTSNGIAATEDGRYLITVQSNTGNLYRINTRSKEIRQVDSRSPRPPGKFLVVPSRNPSPDLPSPRPNDAVREEMLRQE